MIDAGIGAESELGVGKTPENGADFVAVGTYNGLALHYLRSLRDETARVELDVPIFVWGKLNQIPEDNPSNLPVDVTEEVRALAAIVGLRVEDMVKELIRKARGQHQ